MALFGKMSLPRLCEPAMKRIVREALKDSRIQRDATTCWNFNIGAGILFVALLATVLYVRFKGKLTQEERQAKETEKYRYIVGKLSRLTEMRANNNKGALTGLPRWDKPVGIVN